MHTEGGAFTLPVPVTSLNAIMSHWQWRAVVVLSVQVLLGPEDVVRGWGIS